MEAVLIIFQETVFFWWAMGDGGGLPRGFWNITSLTKDWTRAHGNKALSLNHWTTREFQYFRNVTINMGHQTTLHQTMILLYNSHLGTISCPHVHTHNTHTAPLKYRKSLLSSQCHPQSCFEWLGQPAILVHTSTVNMAEPNLYSKFGCLQRFTLRNLHEQQR